MTDLMIPKSGKTLLINGAWVGAASGAVLDLLNPADGGVIGALAAAGAEDIARAAATARREADEGSWPRMPAFERGRVLRRAQALVEADLENLAQLESLDCGKPIGQARADITACARYLEFYAGGADKVHGEVIPYVAGHHAQSWWEPHGVTAHIIPWNYPAQMFGRTLAPALAMGNAVILKPAEDACLTPLRLAQLLLDAGLPPGALQVVTGAGSGAGQALIDHGAVDFISFTGSPQVGTLVQRAAAERLIGCTLELGGKSPQVVFGDADMDAALPVVARAIVQNGGQTCSAGSRLLVESSAYDGVMSRLAELFEDLTAAPPSEDRDLGPLISLRQKRRLERYLADAPEDRLVARGRVSDGALPSGFYVEPRLYGPVAGDSVLAQEELFGPVLVAMPFRDEADALRLANGTAFGLVSGVWTGDGGRQVRMSRGLRCGQVFVNCYGAGGGIELPFGGVGRSGHGREKGFGALMEFGRKKTVAARFDL